MFSVSLGNSSEVDLAGEALAAEKVGTQSLQTHDHVFVDIAKAGMDVRVYCILNAQLLNFYADSRLPRSSHGEPEPHAEGTLPGWRWCLQVNDHLLA